MTEPTPDQYSRHEVLHMAYFLGRAVDRELTEQHSIKANQQWLALAQRASDALAELYQAIGAAAP